MILGLIFGGLTSLGAVLLAALISHLVGFEIWSMSLFMLVPVGGVLGGVMASSGFYYGLRRAIVQPTWVAHAVAVLLALSVVLAGYGLRYRTSGARAAGMPFSEFFSQAVGNRWRSFVVTGRGKAREFERPGDAEGPERKLAIAAFAVELGGFGFGVFLMAVILWRSRRVCLHCGAGFRERALLCYTPWPAPAGTPPRGPPLVAWIDEQRKAMPMPRGPYARIESDLCSRVVCRDGALVMTIGGVATPLPLDETTTWALKQRQVGIVNTPTQSS